MLCFLNKLVIKEESIPPDKNVPIGTSEIVCSFTEADNFLSKASKNLIDPETAKTALTLRKLPDFIAVKESHNGRFILRGEVRCKKNMPKL